MRPDGVSLDVSNGGHGVIFIHCARVKSAFPQVARLRIFPIEVLRVAHVTVGKRPRKRVGFFWNRDQVDVVRHEAVRQDLEAVLPLVLIQEMQVPFAIGIVQKNLHQSIAPLRDMMGQSRRHYSGNSRHRIDDMTK
jgi:hypothetical protein